MESEQYPAMEGAKLRTAHIWATAILGSLVAAALLLPFTDFAIHNPFLSGFFFLRQDMWPAVLFLLVPVLAFWRRELPSSESWLDFFATPTGICTIAAGLAGLCLLGHHFIYMDYNLSRDEQMADFDAYIFAHARLFWPLPKFWQVHALALDPNFMLVIGNHEAWVSAYLPVNAALRAVTGILASPNLTSPLLVALGAVSLWRIAGRLWPQSPSTRGLALVLYAGSAQVLANGMTAYAMSGHLALGLVWLDLFLLNKRWSHLAALTVGFLATGLHQPLFHPLFVLPFLELLYLQGQRRTLAFYLVGYLAIAAFWLAWPVWISSHSVGHTATLEAGTPNYLVRFTHAVQPLSIEAIWLTTLNLIRFVTWQHLLLLTLMLAGIKANWSRDPLARAIAKSFLLPIPVMLILLPYQGHGWGYRYLHGVIGNACLLACYGWVALEAQGLPLRRALIWTTAVTFLVVMPVRAMMVHRMVGAFAGVNSIIDKSHAQFAIVDNTAAPFSDDLVLNRPDLSNRPLRLWASALRGSDMAELCAQGSVAFVAMPTLKPISDFFETGERRSPHLAELRKTAAQAGCEIIPTGTP